MTHVANSDRIIPRQTGLRRPHHLVAEIAAEVARRPQIDFPPAQQLREVDLDLRHRQQAGRGARFEFDEQIYVAIGPVGAFERRAEE
jgi:hypothetical protein